MFHRFGALAMLAVSFNAAALPAEEAYRKALDGARALKADPARRLFRHHWLNAARRFERVAAKHPQSPRAPPSLLAAAQLLEQLSQLSGLGADLDQAIADLEKVCDGYPKADASHAAALALGRIYFERRGRPEAARRVLTQAIARHPSPARIAELKAFLAALPDPPKPTRAKATAARPPAASPLPAQGRRSAQAAEARTRELLDAIARVSLPVRKEPRAESPEDPPSSRPETSAAPAPPPHPEPAREAERANAADTPPESAFAAWPRAKPPGGAPATAAKPDSLRGGKAEGAAPSSAADVDPAKRARALRAASRTPEATLAQQLGLKVHRVVLDPGHGGHDTGAIGRKGTREKDIALALARRLRDRLARAGLEVILTRSGDEFVALEERARIANEARGDLFISLHCNSAPTRKLRGIETYSLNTSSDRYSIRLAARENASSDRAISDLQYILADLATKANTEESSRLASRVQQSLVSQLRAKQRRVLDLGTKEALFYVLLGVRMPAILVETSFLSNPEEERLLSSKSYQADLAAAIASGVQEFLAGRQRVAKVN